MATPTQSLQVVKKLIDFHIDYEIDAESREKLIETINLALTKSQEAAAKAMLGLG